jgi:two-component system response regulator PilR (NtrC family)
MNTIIEHSPISAKASNPDRSAPALPEIVGESPAVRRMLAWVERVASSDLPVLVHGETGSGKECVARTVHGTSRRCAGPFVAINCTAFSETLLDAELFGAVRGAYTGLDRTRPGLFRLAEGGTLFLDEVGDMPPSMQAKLLRVLQEARVRPVGAEQELPVDVRIVAATHHDLERDVLAGTFRADLFYRLAVTEVHVPALRDRTQDLRALIQSLAPRLARETGHVRVRITHDAHRALAAYAWPGNVRELHGVLARALLRANGGEIRATHLGPLHERIAPGDDSLEREMIDLALRDCRGSVTGAARRIGWTRQKLYRRMRALSLRGSPTTSSDNSTFQ